MKGRNLQLLEVSMSCFSSLLWISSVRWMNGSGKFTRANLLVLKYDVSFTCSHKRGIINILNVRVWIIRKGQRSPYVPRNVEITHTDVLGWVGFLNLDLESRTSEWNGIPIIARHVYLSNAQDSNHNKLLVYIEEFTSHPHDAYLQRMIDPTETYDGSMLGITTWVKSEYSWSR